MKYYQVKDDDGNDLGLFVTDRTDDNVEKDIEKCFKMAEEMEFADPSIDFYDAAETYLDEKGISRIFVEEVYVDV